MTDFIHEKPKDPSLTPPAPEDPPMSRKDRQKRVFTYAAVLFGVAFVLILWSFLMTHRSNQLMLSELKDRTNDLQSTVEQNDELRQEVARLEDELAEAQAQLEDALQSNAALEQAGQDATYRLYALNYLMQLERAVDNRNRDWAYEFISRLESDADTPKPLKEYLPTTALHTNPDGNDAEAPADVYQQIVTRLYPDGFPDAQG